MWVIGLVVGAFVGGAYGGAGGVLGALVGLALGILAGSWKARVQRRLSELETRVAALVPQRTAVIALEIAAPVAIAPEVELPAAKTPEISQPAAAVLPVRKGGTGVSPTVAPNIDVAPRSPATTATPVETRHAPRPAWLAWIMGGNTLARVGVLLLFIGVGFLVKYATDHVRVPVAVRLAGVALGGIALLLVGWRLRQRRPGYAMILQGAGVGLLYLTVFGALRLYNLLPPEAAFALLACIAVLSAWLAIRQDAAGLAAVGVGGGFLAPVLTSSHNDNHVLLFSYYALLNVGILGIAWFKAWRSLNLLGFQFTFVIGTLWGVMRYRPEHFASIEPFLILFFLFYVAIGVLYALRQSFALRDYVDATLVFGTPLVVAGLQSGLVRDIPYGMAFSAVGMSAVYLILARLLHARGDERARPLVEAFIALGVVFATIAIPLALDARWTSATWALEGAAMLWVGVRQRRRAVRAFGLLLQFGAGLAFASGLTFWRAAAPERSWPLLNSDFVGALLVGVAGLFSAWFVQRRRGDLTEGERNWGILLLAWGTLWWLGAGWREIQHWLPGETQLSAGVGLLALTAVAFELAARRTAWPMARVPAMLLLPALLLITIAPIARPRRAEAFWHVDAHLFAHGGFLAWLIAIGVVVWLLRAADRADAPEDAGTVLPPDLWHAAMLWLVTLIGAHELAWAGSRVGSGDGVWAMMPWGLVPAVALGVVTTAVGDTTRPVGARLRAYLIVGAIPIAVVLALWSLGVNFTSDGDPLPLPYLPLFNPLDITQALVLVALANWCLRLRRDGSVQSGILNPALLAIVFAALVFVWINGLALRTIHHWFDVPFSVRALWHSRLVQAVLALLWSALALATMVLAHRRYWRAAWIAGALLLALVVAKLFVVDLSQVGGTERIVSFIGVGLLLLLIGYLAPVPPRRPENAS